MNEFDNSLGKKFDFDFNVPSDFSADLKQLKKFIKKDDVIIFYGGEPIVNLEKLKKIMDLFPENRFCMQTNGKLLDKIPKEYMNRFSKILVSIDGNKERTDFNRGNGTYDLILKNINLIRKNNFKGEIVARMTISFPDLFEQAKHLVELKKFDSVHWQLDAGFYKFDFNEKEFSKFTDEYNKSVDKLLNFWISEMKKGKVIKFYPFLGIFESLYFNRKTKLRCGSGYANYTITTDGKITACPIMNNIKNFYCGDLNSNPKKLKKIYMGKPCSSCRYIDLCGGRCLYSNYAKLWPVKGQKLICKTIVHLINSVKKRTPEIKELINKKVISEKDFEYEKYFGPEIIP
jgi:putative peptide-modifying radical SAM enzyme